LRGSLLHRHRAALFLRADSPLYRTVGSRRFQFSFFDTLQPLEQCWNRLVDFRPTVLAAPPSVLVWLADQPGAGRLLAPPGIVLSVADVLEERERERIERGFGSKVGEIYQATEGFLAATCPHGRMHWNEDAIFVEKEWLDESRRRFVPVITDFRRLTQPIIRYRLDDVILQGEGGRCECGSIFETLGAIEGRCDDLLDLPRADGCGRITVFPDLIRRAAALALPAGVDYLIRQTLSGGWEAAFSHEHPPEPLRREIEELCRRLGALPPELRLIPWTPLVRHVKRRRVRRESSPPGCSAP
jgi:putative adenylate-forming enzyme